MLPLQRLSPVRASILGSVRLRAPCDVRKNNADKPGKGFSGHATSPK